MDFRDYLYLDSKRLEDYLSHLEPGVLQELRETETSEQTNAARGAPMGAVPGTPSALTSSSERTVKISEKNSFNRLYGKMKSEESIGDINDAAWRPHVRGMVEAQRYYQPSPVNEMIDSLFELIEMMQEMDVPGIKDSDSQQTIAMMSTLLKSPAGDDRSLPMISNKDEDSHPYSVIFSTKREYLLCDEEEFEGEMTLVGRVSKHVAAEESLDLLDYLQILPRKMRRNKAISGKIKEGIVQLFENWPDGLGPSLDREALIVPGPVIIVDPLVVYS
jgi:hypothetical protein